jgi:hypothetical protein
MRTSIYGILKYDRQPGPREFPGHDAAPADADFRLFLPGFKEF